MLLAAVLPAAVQISKTVTLVTGTAARVVGNRTMVNSLFIQVQPGGTHVVYVLYADPDATCSTSTTSQIVATLGPGSATQPGMAFTFPSNNDATTQAGGFDANWWCVQGTTAETVIVSYDKR